MDPDSEEISELEEEDAGLDDEEDLDQLFGEDERVGNNHNNANADNHHLNIIM